MLNNFIGGGQVFLHKIRMFQQVFVRTVSVALLLGIVASVSMYNKENFCCLTEFLFPSKSLE